MENDWPAGEVFVAIKKAGSSVQRVPGVIDGRALWKQQHHKTNKPINVRAAAWKAWVIAGSFDSLLWVSCGQHIKRSTAPWLSSGCRCLDGTHSAGRNTKITAANSLLLNQLLDIPEPFCTREKYSWFTKSSKPTCCWLMCQWPFLQTALFFLNLKWDLIRDL